MHHSIPALGLGTWGRTGAGGRAAILAALEIGYRHLDTAQSYGTEANVGAAVRACGLPRGDVFVTTKVADTNLDRSRFEPSLRRSLDTIGLGPVDLTLIHWPSHGDAVPFEHYIEALATAREAGLTRLIGVSNFPIALIDRAVMIVGEGALATNQVEIHPFLQNRVLTAHCRGLGIGMTAYMPLAQGRVPGDPVLEAVAAKHGATAAQVALAFLLAHDIIVIPASGSRAHLEENFGASGVTLDGEDLGRIAALDRGMRIIDPPKAPDWD
jgi:2,5-diketo-D-gluconate reductase B